jgi:hypothetical protein
MERSDRRADAARRNSVSHLGGTGSLSARALVDPASPREGNAGGTKPPVAPDAGPVGIASKVEAAHAQCAAGRHVYQTLLLLSAVTFWVLLLGVFAAIGGCVQRTATPSYAQCGRSANWHCGGQPYWQVQAEEPQASLIFPAEPDLAQIPANQIMRADWPTTAGLFSYGQAVNYQEYWYDQQGLGPCSPNYGYRTFTFWRNGLEVGP